LGTKLIRIAESREKKRTTNNMVTLEVKRRVRLEGVELEMYLAKKKEKEQIAARQRLETVRRNARLENVESSDESDDEDTLAAVVAAVTSRGKGATPTKISEQEIDMLELESIFYLNNF
jgi:hypothetical protein